jgi:hypothetical protein
MEHTALYDILIHHHILVSFHYVDDVLIVYDASLTDIDVVLNHFYTTTSPLQFTTVKEQHNFLDIMTVHAENKFLCIFSIQFEHFVCFIFTYPFDYFVISFTMIYLSL